MKQETHLDNLPAKLPTFCVVRPTSKDFPLSALPGITPESLAFAEKHGQKTFLRVAYEVVSFDTKEELDTYTEKIGFNR